MVHRQKTVFLVLFLGALAAGRAVVEHPKPARAEDEKSGQAPRNGKPSFQMRGDDIWVLPGDVSLTDCLRLSSDMSGLPIIWIGRHQALDGLTVRVKEERKVEDAAAAVALARSGGVEVVRVVLPTGREVLEAREQKPREQKPLRGKSAAPFVLAGRPGPAAGVKGVTISHGEVPLKDVARFLADFIGEDVVLDQALSGDPSTPVLHVLNDIYQVDTDIVTELLDAEDFRVRRILKDDGKYEWRIWRRTTGA